MSRIRSAIESSVIGEAHAANVRDAEIATLRETVERLAGALETSRNILADAITTREPFWLEEMGGTMEETNKENDAALAAAAAVRGTK